MLYLITKIDGSQVYMNERIIQKIVPNEDGTFTLYHFNETSFKIKTLPSKF
jgi:uncharacterized protein YlzI (FlbEa/FlbD family)